MEDVAENVTTQKIRIQIIVHAFVMRGNYYGSQRENLKKYEMSKL